ncbi:MAG: protein-glutamate O-methyltransferase CheR [Nitrospirae bacterium]|nr:protein-glutamate O-methyltransferase CheR [Nitrospirota bacterium]
MEVLKSFDLDINNDLFRLFADLIYGTSGIRLNINKKGLLVSRLGKRLKVCGIRSFHEYYQRVKSDNEELVEMLNCISTNTTKLFREIYHFQFLKNTVIPELLKRNARDRIIRIWSAGCSTGEEPYSIAITVLEAMKLNNVRPEDWNVRILATDISTQVLRTAEAGNYELEQLPDDLPPNIVSAYFLKGVGANEGCIRVKNLVKDIVRFRRLNLKDGTYPFKRKFDVIFCRNVMIYFDEKMKRHVLSNFHYYLTLNGYLFLGHSETMLGRDQFVPVHITAYRKI